MEKLKNEQSSKVVQRRKCGILSGSFRKVCIEEVNIIGQISFPADKEKDFLTKGTACAKSIEVWNSTVCGRLKA